MIFIVLNFFYIDEFVSVISKIIKEFMVVDLFVVVVVILGK